MDDETPTDNEPPFVSARKARELTGLTKQQLAAYGRLPEGHPFRLPFEVVPWGRHGARRWAVRDIEAWRNASATGVTTRTEVAR